MLRVPLLHVASSSASSSECNSATVRSLFHYERVYRSTEIKEGAAATTAAAAAAAADITARELRVWRELPASCTQFSAPYINSSFGASAMSVFNASQISPPQFKQDVVPAGVSSSTATSDDDDAKSWCVQVAGRPLQPMVYATAVRSIKEAPVGSNYEKFLQFLG